LYAPTTNGSIHFGEKGAGRLAAEFSARRLSTTGLDAGWVEPAARGPNFPPSEDTNGVVDALPDVVDKFFHMKLFPLVATPFLPAGLQPIFGRYDLCSLRVGLIPSAAAMWTARNDS